MILAGDELRRSQRGNNNAYCQDNELSWFNWNVDTEDRRFFEFVRNLLALRKEHPAFRRTQFLQGRSLDGTHIKDIVWLTPRGTEMSDQEWSQGTAHCLGLFLAGDATDSYDAHGHLLADDDFLLLLNNADAAAEFKFAQFLPRRSWEVLLDTSIVPSMTGGSRGPWPETSFLVRPRSLVLLCQRRSSLKEV